MLIFLRRHDAIYKKRGNSVADLRLQRLPKATRETAVSNYFVGHMTNFLSVCKKLRRDEVKMGFDFEDLTLRVKMVDG